MFIHTRTRLFCELHRAERWLTHKDFLVKWLKEDTEKLEIIDIETREKIEAFWKTLDENDNQIKDRVVFHLMPCASRTQYCTEIHVVVHPDSARFGVLAEELGSLETEVFEDWRKTAQRLWKQRLEALRECVNGDWVIEDKDLTRAVLLRSRL